MQADVLDARPDNGETTGLGREGVNLIDPLPHIAEEAFDGIDNTAGTSAGPAAAG